jgi:site-specific DNA-methyltransferase (adenine-specific)
VDNKSKKHPHQKPLELQKILIEAVSNLGDLVVDPAAGSYSVLEACLLSKRIFLGCDIETF